MRCLVVGADRLGSAPKILSERFGVTDIIHWTGRKKPRKVNKLSLVVVYTGFAGHGLVSEAKKLARKNNAKIIFLNRGLSELVS